MPICPSAHPLLGVPRPRVLRTLPGPRSQAPLDSAPQAKPLQLRDQTPELLVSMLPRFPRGPSASCLVSQPCPGCPPASCGGRGGPGGGATASPLPPPVSAGRVWCVAQLRQPRSRPVRPAGIAPGQCQLPERGRAGKSPPWCLRRCCCSGRCWPCSGRGVAVPPSRKVRGGLLGHGGDRQHGEPAAGLMDGHSRRGCHCWPRRPPKHCRTRAHGRV